MAKKNSPEMSEKSRKKNSSPLEAALKYLSYQARTEKEMVAKLSQRYNQKEVQDTITRLKELKLIDDTEYAQLYIQSRSRTRPRSSKLLTLELKRKGITNYPEISSVDDFELAKLAIQKKKNFKTREQAIRFLQSRGFSWEIIQAVLKLEDVS